jgi:hypothetical protein
MITTQTPGKQTGAFSRIQNPYLQITAESLQARLRAGKYGAPPIRNMLAGAGPTSIWGRIVAWFRGEI